MGVGVLSRDLCHSRFPRENPLDMTTPFPALYILLTPVPLALCRFDIYRKVPKDLTQPTYSGAISE